MTLTKDDVFSIFENYKKQNGKPFVLEILGTPNSGKTNALEALEKILKRSGIKHKIIYEAANKCKIKDKLSPEFNIWTLSETIKQLLEVQNGNYEIVICERGIIDALCWGELHYKKKKIKKEELEVITKYVLLNRFANFFNCFFILKCDSEASIARENLEGLLDVHGTIVNYEIIEEYNNALANVSKKYGNTFGIVKSLDTSRLSQTDINKWLFSSIIEIITNQNHN